MFKALCPGTGNVLVKLKKEKNGHNLCFLGVFISVGKLTQL